MARFILLYCKDDKAADLFTHSLEDDQIRVVGVYQDPTHKPCDCKGDHTSPRQNRFHSKYGWYVHGGCGRVSKLWRSNYGKRIFQVFGFNLLPREHTPKSLQNPPTMGDQ